MSEYPIESIRSDYQALQDVCYLNTGTVGIMSETVLGRHLDRIARYERTGHVGEAEARNGYDEARRELADLINAKPAELALTRNASDGVNYVLAGLTFPEGAGFLTTDEEHPAVLLPMTHAARRCGGSVVTISLDVPDDQLLASLRRTLETSVISIAVISHVSCETGRRLPIREMCDICRDHGVLTLVDAAQSVGQFAVDMREIGGDFATGNGHKWLCGPKGTGFLYIREDRVDALTPPYVGAGATDPEFDRTDFPPHTTSSSWRFSPDAERFEFGTRNWHLYGATVDAIQQLREIGAGAIENHVAAVSSELKACLDDRPGISLHTPTDWAASSGLITFSVDGWNGVNLSNRLWNDFSIIQRRVQEPSAVRVSCAHYTSRDDVTRLLDALDQLTSD